MAGTVIETKIFDRDAVVNDQINVYNPWALDYEVYSFQGFTEETYNGWNYLHYNDDWMQVTEPVKNFTVNCGEGIYVTPWDYSHLTMNTAGQVANTEESQQWVMPVGEYTQPIMNPYPVATTFKDLEAFAQVNDQLCVVNAAANDCDIYNYQGPTVGWNTIKWGSDWVQHTDEKILPGSTAIALKPGQVGYYVNYNSDGRVWTVTLPKTDK